jgi:hypothetical protein
VARSQYDGLISGRFLQPAEHQVAPDVLHDSSSVEDSSVVAIYPLAANVSSNDRVCSTFQFGVLCFGVHVLHDLEFPCRLGLLGMKRTLGTFLDIKRCATSFGSLRIHQGA